MVATLLRPGFGAAGQGQARGFQLPNWRWEDRSHTCDHPSAPHGMVRAYCNSLYAVMWFEPQTEWGTVTHLMVTAHDGEPVRKWRHLQRIKNELVGVDRVAVEVFPKQADVIDDAHVTHLWVLPEGFSLPFNLKDWEGASKAAKADAA